MAFLFFKFNGSKPINLLIFLYNIWLKNPKQFFPTVSHWFALAMLQSQNRAFKVATDQCDLFCFFLF